MGSRRRVRAGQHLNLDASELHNSSTSSLLLEVEPGAKVRIHGGVLSPGVRLQARLAAGAELQLVNCIRKEFIPRISCSGAGTVTVILDASTVSPDQRPAWAATVPALVAALLPPPPAAPLWEELASLGVEIRGGVDDGIGGIGSGGGGASGMRDGAEGRGDRSGGGGGGGADGARAAGRAVSASWGGGGAGGGGDPGSGSGDNGSGKHYGGSGGGGKRYGGIGDGSGGGGGGGAAAAALDASGSIRSAPAGGRRSSSDGSSICGLFATIGSSISAGGADGAVFPDLDYDVSGVSPFLESDGRLGASEAGRLSDGGGCSPFIRGMAGSGGSAPLRSGSSDASPFREGFATGVVRGGGAGDSGGSPFPGTAARTGGGEVGGGGAGVTELVLRAPWVLGVGASADGGVRRSLSLRGVSLRLAGGRHGWLGGIKIVAIGPDDAEEEPGLGPGGDAGAPSLTLHGVSLQAGPSWPQDGDDSRGRRCCGCQQTFAAVAAAPSGLGWLL